MDGQSTLARAGALATVVLLAAVVVLLVIINGHLADLATEARHQSGFACMSVTDPTLYEVDGEARPADCLNYANAEDAGR